jgi:hypothetical protein
MKRDGGIADTVTGRALLRDLRGTCPQNLSPAVSVFVTLEHALIPEISICRRISEAL